MDSWPLLMLPLPLKHHPAPSNLSVYAQPPFSTVLAYTVMKHIMILTLTTAVILTPTTL